MYAILNCKTDDIQIVEEIIFAGVLLVIQKEVPSKKYVLDMKYHHGSFLKDLQFY